MIRINLLPVRAAKKREQGRVQLALGVMVILAAFAGNYLWYNAAEGDLGTAQRRVQDTQRQITQLERIIGQVKDIQKKKQDLQKKLDVIAKLRKQKTGPVKLMDSLATIIPKQVWVTQFAEKGGHFTMQGKAMTHVDLASFLSALKGSKYFKGVQLKDASLAKGPGGEPIVKFTLTGQADYAA